MARRTWLPLAIVIGFVLLIRLPFLNQAIQGDDIYYLFGAEHALIDPAHPNHAQYPFQGDMVDMRGHPHPPFNSWFLALLLVCFHDVYEVPFHAAYLLFSLIAAISMWGLARRFSDNPLWATLLFLVTPAFVINGNSLESDIPFLAFWMAGIALFVHGRLVLSSIALALAGLCAFQAVIVTPILLVYLWLNRPRRSEEWVVPFVPVIVLIAWQVYEKATSGELPATVLAGYFSTYGLQRLANKLTNAVSLTAHTGWLVFPALAAWRFRSRWIFGVIAAAAGAFLDPNPLFWIPFGIGVMVIAWCIRKPQFLTAWILIFFAAALIIFFAGSARYLLPMAAPLALLAAEEKRWAPAAFVMQAVLSLCLSFVNYQQWGQYRTFAATIPPADSHHRVWVNGEWGLRFYLESRGALPVMRGQSVRPGDMLVASEIGYPGSVFTGGGQLTRVADTPVTSTLPLCLFGIHCRSGYSTASAGFRPFDISTQPLDVVHTFAVVERKPTLSLLPMDAPEAQSQIVSGVYDLEGKTRWMGEQAVVLLKPPAKPERLYVRFYVAGDPRRVTMALDGRELVAGTFQKGVGVLTTHEAVTGSTATISVDRTFQVPGDNRKLGIVLMEVGFAE